MEQILVTAVIPCLNEERTIAICVGKARRSFEELGVTGEGVVVDNGSTDRTAEGAGGGGSKVVSEPEKS